MLGLLTLSAAVMAFSYTPGRLSQARFVAIGYEAGGRFVSEAEGSASSNVPLQTREAHAAVRKLLRDWDRYTIVERGIQADLLIVVRTGQVVSVVFETRFGGRGGASPSDDRPPRVPASSIDAEGPPNEDTLAVYQSVDGGFGALVWKGQLRRGFSFAPSPLFEKLRTDVDALPRPQP